MSAFNKIAGYENEKEELRALVEIFNNRKKYELKGASLPRGIIFYGPTGTGKTLFSEVLAAECSLKKVNICVSDSASENTICRRIRKAFAKGVNSRTPTMIFFDELDKLLPNEAEEYYTDRSKTILTQLLTLLDGMEKANNIVLVATCNDYHTLPESITRPGRFDKKICLNIPDYNTRVAILDMYMKAAATHFATSAESIARITPGFSPAALKTLVNDCILSSDENNYASEELIHKKILEIKEENIPTERSERSYIIDAVRNVGAFVAARAYSNSDYVLTVEGNSVSNSFLDAIINDSAYYYSEDDYYDGDDEDSEHGNSPDLCSKNDILAAITALLGGIAAEELLFNKLYDNVQFNLDQTNSLFLKMAGCGMLGLDLYYELDGRFPYSDSFVERLNEKVTKMRLECYEKARTVVSKNESLIKKLVSTLAKQKTIEKHECENLIREHGGIA